MGLNVVSIVAYIGYLGYMMHRGTKLVAREGEDFTFEYAVTAAVEALAALLIPFSVSLQIDVLKLKTPEQFLLYDEEKQEYIEAGKREKRSFAENGDPSVEKLKGRIRANYIRSVALFQSINQRQPSQQ